MKLETPNIIFKRIKQIFRGGFTAVRQKGSHGFFKHPDGRTTVVAIHSNKDIKRSLLKGILDEIQITREEFFKKYK